MFNRSDPRTVLQRRLNCDSNRVEASCEPFHECGAPDVNAVSSEFGERPIFQTYTEVLKSTGLFADDPPG